MFEHLIRLGLRFRNLTLGFAVVLALAGLHAGGDPGVDGLVELYAPFRQIEVKRIAIGPGAFQRAPGAGAPGAAHHLIRDHHDPVAVAQLADARQEAGLGKIVKGK